MQIGESITCILHADTEHPTMLFDLSSDSTERLFFVLNQLFKLLDEARSIRSKGLQMSGTCLRATLECLHLSFQTRN
jgi:hypothetical protein